jgi:hypothetical protein
VPIRLFLDRDWAFDPEHIDSMSRALAGALTALGLIGKSHDLSIVVASRIIDLARAGERDTERLTSETLRSLRQ